MILSAERISRIPSSKRPIKPFRWVGSGSLLGVASYSYQSIDIIFNSIFLPLIFRSSENFERPF